jgi:hypothetical protein
MKKPAETEIKQLIRRMRLVCDTVGDCPIKAARDRSQIDCLGCILRDISLMAEELRALRDFKTKVTEYNSTITKLEAVEEPALLESLKKQIKEGGK